MSGFTGTSLLPYGQTPEEYGLTPEEQQKSRELFVKGAGAYLPGLTANAATNVVPGGPGGIGAVNKLLGALGAVYDAARKPINEILDQTGIAKHMEQLTTGDPHLPAPFEFFTKAGESAKETENKIYEALPHSTAATPEEQQYLDAARSIGGATGDMAPVPGVGAALKLAPAAVGKVASFLLPTVEHATTNIPVATGLGTVATAIAPSPAEGATPTPVGNQGLVIDPATGNVGTPNAGGLGITPTPPDATKPVQVAENKGFSFFDQPATATDATPAAPPGFSFFDTPQGPPPSEGMTWGQILGAGAAAVAAGLAVKYVHGLSGATTSILRDARYAAPKIADAAADFNNARIANAAGDIGPGPANRPAAPTPRVSLVQEIATKAKNGMLDDTELLQSYIKLSQTDPTIGKRLANQASTVFDEMAWHNSLRQTLKLGHDIKSGISFEKPEILYKNYAGLTNEERTAFNRGMAAANEENNRAILRRRGGSVAEHDFPNTSDAELRAYVTNMQANPKLKAMQDMYRGIQNDVLEIGVRRGFFPAKEKAQMLSSHPDHVADVDKNGRILHALGPRSLDPMTSINEMNSDVIAPFGQHIESLLRQYELNEFRTALIDHMMDVQSSVRGAPQVVEKLQGYGHNQPTTPSYYPTMGAEGSGPRDTIIALRRGTGVEYYRIADDTYFNLFKTNNAARMRSGLGIMDASRKLVQWGSTGVGSLLSGRAFPPVNVVRTAITGPINRPLGYSTGLIDTALQAASGGRFGNRILPDPSSLVGIPYSYLRGRFDQRVMNLANLFDKANPNPVTQMLNTTITPTRMDKIADWLRNYYLNTATHEMRSYGIGGQGQTFRAAAPSLAGGGKGSAIIRTVSGELVPRAFMPSSPSGRIKAFWLNIQRPLDEAFAEMSDAAHQFYYRTNRARGMSPMENAEITRNLVGNPAKQGASAVARGVNEWTPYLNVSTQGLARRVQAFKESPVGTTAAWFGGPGLTLAALSMLTSMRNDRTAAHLNNEVSLQGKAANVHIYTNDDPDQRLEISLPQEERSMYAVQLGLLHTGLDLFNTYHDKYAREGVYSFLKDLLSEHVSNEVQENILYGASDALSLISPPPIVEMALNAGDMSLRPDLAHTVHALQDDGGLSFGAFLKPNVPDHPLPNQAEGDNHLFNEDGKKWSTILNSLLGGASYVYDMARNGASYMSGDRHSFMDSMGQVGKDFVQRVMDKNPMVNTLIWDNNIKLARPPIVEMTERRLDVMKQATQGAKSAEKMEGTTGGSHPLPVSTFGDQKRVPTDPTMRAMFFAVAAESSHIESRHMTEINQMKKQIANEANQFVNPQERRVWENKMYRIIADKYRVIADRLEDLDANLSGMAGDVPVRAEKIDWTKGPEQFHQ